MFVGKLLQDIQMAKFVFLIFVVFIQTGTSASVPNLGPQKSCKCELYSKCTWSKKMVNQIAVLEKTNPIRIGWSKSSKTIPSTSPRTMRFFRGLASKMPQK